ncbi:MAG: hypothetical protein ACREVR_15015 [Burkholderiales bacterium]
MDPARGQKWTCVDTSAYLGKTATDPGTGIEYRIAELHTDDLRCLLGANRVLAVVEPTSAEVREQARRQEQARREQAAREEAARMQQKQQREIACLQGGGTWNAGYTDYAPGSCERPQPQSRSLNCTSTRMGNTVNTNCY